MQEASLLAKPSQSGLLRVTSSEAPYVGPRPFQRGDRARFFGRDREAVDLKYRVMAHPVTLLYAMSGAGKTSLVNAKLIPMLEQEHCRVLPVSRVRGSTGNLNPLEIPNIFVFHALMGWHEQAEADVARRVKACTLKDELMPHAENGDDEDAPLLVAVFDQFEELFTVEPGRWADRQGFFEQLAEALQAIPSLRVLLAMREDFVASMDPYAALLPDRLRTRCRLERLRRETALDAVIKPLEGTGYAFAPDVAEQLVDNLMKIHIRPQLAGDRIGDENLDADLPCASDESAATSSDLPQLNMGPDALVATAEYVEPVQLQVVCQNLWQNLAPNEHVITTEHVESCGEVNQALARFYESCVTDAARAASVSEAAVRRWFNQELITPAGTRGLVLRGRGYTGRLPNQAVDVLEGYHLIRSEDRGGARWYELSHDRFIEPIQNSNQQWQSSRPGQALWKELEHRAAAWEKAPEAVKPAQLLTEDELIRAEAWKTGSDSVELEPSARLRRFLEASCTALAQAKLEAEIETERREARAKARHITFLKWGSLGLGVLATVAMMVGWGFWYLSAQARKSEKAARQSEKLVEIREGAIKAALKIDKDPREAVDDVWKALIKARDSLGGDLDGTIAALTRPILSHLYQRSELDDRAAIVARPEDANAKQGDVTQVAFAPTRAPGAPVVTGVATGPRVVLGGKGGLVRLWDLGDAGRPDDEKLVAELKLAETTDRGGDSNVNTEITRLAFDREGGRVAIATGDVSSADTRSRGGAWIWEPEARPDGLGTWRFLTGHEGPVADIAFSPNNEQVATASYCLRSGAGSASDSDPWDGVVKLYGVKTGGLERDYRVNGRANHVAFDRTGRRLVVATGNVNGTDAKARGRVIVIDLETDEDVRMERHDCPAAIALFSPDGHLVVSGGADGVIWVHDAGNRQPIATLPGHNQPISDLAFSLDGSRLVSASGDRTARIWDAGRWRDFNPRAESGPREWGSLVTLVGHKAWLTDAEFSRDGTLVLTAAFDRTARVWDARTGEALVTLLGHRGPVLAARFHAYGALVVTAGDQSARVWDAGQVEPARLWLKGHQAAVRDVEFSPNPDRPFALTAGADGVAYLWKVDWKAVATGNPRGIQPEWSFKPEKPTSALTDVAFSPGDGKLAAAAGLDGSVRVWDIDTRRELDMPREDARAGGALGVTFSPRGTYLLTAWADGKMRLFRRQGTHWSRTADPWPGSATRLSPQLFDADERVLVTPNMGLLRVTEASGSVLLWDVAHPDRPRKKLAPPKEGLGPVTDVAVHRDGKWIAAATQGLPGAVHFWNLDGSPAPSSLTHPVGVERVVFSPDGQQVVTEAEDGQGRIWSWRAPARSAPTVLPGLSGPNPQLAFSVDGALLVSDGISQTPDSGAGVGRVWDATGQSRWVLKGPRNALLAMNFLSAAKDGPVSGDPAEIVTINRDNQVQYWPPPFDVALGVRRGPTLKATAAALSRDGKHAATGARDGTVRLWKTNTGRTYADLKGHEGLITGVAFSGDGMRVVTASLDATVRVWQAEEGGAPERSERACFKHDDPVTVARFLDDTGSTIVTATGDLRRLRWQPEDALKDKAIYYRLELKAGTLRPRAEPIVAIETMKRDSSLREDSPMGVLAAAISPHESRVFLGCGGKDTKYDIVLEADPSRGKDLHFDPEKKDPSPRSGSSKAFSGHSDQILDVTVSQDGALMATASADNTARIWSLKAATTSKNSPLLSELRGHSGDVATVSFSPNGQYVVTVSRQDGTARVWDVQTGNPLYVMGMHRSSFNSAALDELPGPRQYTDDVAAAAFSADGKLLITGHGDGLARVYRLDLCGSLDDLLDVTQRRRAQATATPARGRPPTAATHQARSP